MTTHTPTTLNARDQRALTALKALPEATLPDDTLIIFLDREDDAATLERSIAEGIAAVRDGQHVLFRYLESNDD